MRFRVENGEVVLKKWWFSKEIRLKNVTHIIQNDKMLNRFYEGEKLIYQCQWSIKSIKLVDAVFKQPACQYIKFPVFEDDEEIDYKIIDTIEQEEYVKSKEDEVQAIVEKYNSKHKFQIKARFGYDEILGFYCYYISQDKEDAPWIFQCRPVQHHILNKDTSKNELYKNVNWKEMFKQDLKVLDRCVAKNKNLFSV